MLVPFSQLPPTSKVWIYQGNRKFSEDQKDIITGLLKSFTNQWEVHGAPLEASFDLRYDQFIILAANDSASGCSIDTSVRIMKEIGDRIGIDFFDRNLIAFSENSEVKLIAMKDLKSTFNAGGWNENSLFFNNAASTIEDFQTNWLSKAGKSWLKRYFLKESFTK
jgi:hypothetical protein